MQPISTTMAGLLRRSHTSVVTATVVQAGLEIFDLTPYLIDGSVRVARGAVHRTADLEVGDFDGTLTPLDAQDLLSALSSNDVLLRRGVRLPDGTTETVGLGLLRITRCEPSTGGKLRVQARDYGWVLQRAKFEVPYGIAAGTNYLTGLQELLSDGYPTLDYNLPALTETTPLITWDEQGDRWAAAQDIAEALGYLLEFDPGLAAPTVRMRPEPQLAAGAGDPVWSFDEADSEDSTITESSRDLDADGIHNVVIATGETSGDGTPPRATAEDGDPASPTYAAGPFGRAPTWYSSPLLTTVEMCQQAAYTRLSTRLGAAATAQVTGLCNPALELNDVLTLGDTRSGVSGRYLADQFTIPLRNQLMRLDARQEVTVVVA